MSNDSFIAFEETWEEPKTYLDRWGHVIKKEEKREIKKAFCLPTMTRVSNTGRFALDFGRKIKVNGAQNLTKLETAIKNSRTIQFLLKSRNPDLQRRDSVFDWKLTEITETALKFQIFFDKPEMISADSRNTDQLVSVLVNTRFFIKCDLSGEELNEMMEAYGEIVEDVIESQLENNDRRKLAFLVKKEESPIYVPSNYRTTAPLPQ